MINKIDLKLLFTRTMFVLTYELTLSLPKINSQFSAVFEKGKLGERILEQDQLIITLPLNSKKLMLIFQL